MGQYNEKIMSLREAVSKFINDGDMIVEGNFCQGTPYATIHEIIRQKKKNLIFVVMAAVDQVDLMVFGNCVDKIITAYYHRGGGIRYQRELDRRLKTKTIELEDYTNFTLSAMLKAGATGQTFAPVLKGIKYTDVFNVRAFLGDDKFKSITCPYTGNEIVVAPALNPDVAIVHVQRADKYGNAQAWGSVSYMKWACLASKKIIVTCEEIVENDKIKHSPFLTQIPSFRVNAVCEEPWGGHPSNLAGYYNTDMNFRGNIFGYLLSKRAEEKFMAEWVYGLKDRKEYIQHYIERFSEVPLQQLRAEIYQTDQINLGHKKTTWDADNFCFKLGLTKEEYDLECENKGEIEL